MGGRYVKEVTMHKNDIEKFRNEIGNLPIMADRWIAEDNLAIALATYFESLPECPENDIDDQTGWSQWAIDKTNDVLDRIIAKFISGICQKVWERQINVINR